MFLQKNPPAMTRAQTIAEIEAAMRRAEEALRRRDPDALAGRVGDLGKVQNSPAPKVATKITPREALLHPEKHE